MKRIALKTGVLGLMAIAAFSVLAACSAQNQTTSQTSNPTATTTASPSMDHSNMNHGNMGGMNHGMDLGPADAEFDLRFIDAMTPHHRGAVEMATAAKQKSKRPEIQKLAQEIITSQQTEITQMKQWRKAWYNQ